MTPGISSANLAAKAREKGQKCPGRTIVHQGRVVFGAMDEVVFGRPASEALVEQLNRLAKLK
jgi:maleylacetate reductase